jgi:two-component system, NtrC family, response regulator GlrR
MSRPKRGSAPDPATQPLEGALASLGVGRFSLTVLDGPGAGRRWTSTGERCSIGAHGSNDFVLEDSTVSRFHCEIVIDARGCRVRDLESLNGTSVDALPIVDAYLRSGSVLQLGRAALQFQPTGASNRLTLSERTQFGSLVGASVAMRAVFALLECAAASESTTLLEGETGTGKDGAAEAIHAGSARARRPFVVVDCSAIPGDLLESELFGHERGAFTGATARRIGAFEEASSGTIFLDEVGELPLDLQPKLLRALEKREIRRLGSNQMIPIDVRVIAATNRDLRLDVNAGRFRPDLYFRLAVLKITLPPLRRHLEDLPLLVERILETLRADPQAAALLRSAEFTTRLAAAAWPGNVRELRNYVESCLVFREPLPLGDGHAGDQAEEHQPFSHARRLALAEFERRYLQALLGRHPGDTLAAAREAQIDRAYLYRMLRRHRMLPR